MHRIPWPRILDELRRLILLLLGAGLSAVGYAVFQVPYNIAAGGVSGIAILVNHFTGWPVSTFYLVANIPLFIVGYFYLGRWRFLWSTALVVLIFSFATQWLEVTLPQYLAAWPITDNVLLSAIWAGLVGGIGGGLVYWAGVYAGRHGHRRPRDPGQDRAGVEPNLPLCRWHDCRGCGRDLRLGDRAVLDVDAAVERHRDRLCARRPKPHAHCHHHHQQPAAHHRCPDGRTEPRRQLLGRGGWLHRREAHHHRLHHLPSRRSPTSSASSPTSIPRPSSPSASPRKRSARGLGICHFESNAGRRVEVEIVDYH